MNKFDETIAAAHAAGIEHTFCGGVMFFQLQDDRDDEEYHAFERALSRLKRSDVGVPVIVRAADGAVNDVFHRGATLAPISQMR